MPPAPGSRLGPYEILAPLGAGGMGGVYRARGSKLKRGVAIKVLPEAFATDGDRMARFQREAGGIAAIVMQLVEGETLAERLVLVKAGAKGLRLDEALDIARQVADNLETAHELGVIHRDLKN